VASEQNVRNQIMSRVFGGIFLLLLLGFCTDKYGDFRYEQGKAEGQHP